MKEKRRRIMERRDVQKCSRGFDGLGQGGRERLVGDINS